MISFTRYTHDSQLYSYQDNNRRIVLALHVVKEKQRVFKTTEVPTDLHRYLDSETEDTDGDGYDPKEVPTDLYRYLDSETEDTDGDGYDPKEVPTDLYRYLDSETEDTDGDGYDPNNGKCYRLVYDDSPSSSHPSNLSE